MGNPFIRVVPNDDVNERAKQRSEAVMRKGLIDAKLASYQRKDDPARLELLKEKKEVEILLQELKKTNKGIGKDINDIFRNVITETLPVPVYQGWS